MLKQKLSMTFYGSVLWVQCKQVVMPRWTPASFVQLRLFERGTRMYTFWKAGCLFFWELIYILGVGNSGEVNISYMYKLGSGWSHSWLTYKDNSADCMLFTAQSKVNMPPLHLECLHKPLRIINKLPQD